MARSSAGKSTSFSVRVVEQIDAARKKAGMTHAETFERAGLSQNYYYKRMRGELPFNTNDIDAIAKALQVDPFEVMYAAAKLYDDDQKARPS